MAINPFNFFKNKESKDINKLKDLLKKEGFSITEDNKENSGIGGMMNYNEYIRTLSLTIAYLLDKKGIIKGEEMMEVLKGALLKGDKTLAEEMGKFMSKTIIKPPTINCNCQKCKALKSEKDPIKRLKIPSLETNKV